MLTAKPMASSIKVEPTTFKKVCFGKKKSSFRYKSTKNTFQDA